MDGITGSGTASFARLMVNAEATASFSAEIRRARLTLEDCRRALERLRTDPTGYDWRDGWFTAVARLRQVGHVLDKVDGNTDTALRQAIDEVWSLPKPAIYTDFIEAERNLVVKQNRAAARHSITIRPGGATKYDYVMAEGPFAGRDPRDVYAEAIEWWEAHLDRVDQRAAELRT